VRLFAVDSIDSVDTRAWDQLALPRSFYMGSGWLRFCERMDKSQHASYAVVEQGGTYIAAVPIFVVERAGNVHYDITRLFPDLASPGEPQMLVGSSRGYHNRLLIAPSLGREERSAALRLIAGHVAAVAAEHRARRAWWLYLDDESVRELRQYASASPRVLRGDCQIDLPTGGYSEYLAATRHRKQIRKEEDKFLRAGYSLDRKKLSQILPEAGALLANTQRRYGFTVTDESMTDVLRVQCEATTDSAVAYTCSLDGVMAGFCLTYHAGSTIYGRAVGFDYERLLGAAEYFMLSYYEPIRDAYESGMTVIHLGTSAYDAKVLRGASVRPLWALPFGEPAWSAVAATEHNAAKWRELRDAVPGPRDVVVSELWPDLAGLTAQRAAG
jgi:hypothetical protein